MSFKVLGTTLIRGAALKLSVRAGDERKQKDLSNIIDSSHSFFLSTLFSCPFSLLLSTKKQLFRNIWRRTRM